MITHVLVYNDPILFQVLCRTKSHVWWRFQERYCLTWGLILIEKVNQNFGMVFRIRNVRYQGQIGGFIPKNGWQIGTKASPRFRSISYTRGWNPVSDDDTVMILSFRTDMPGQTVQTQIRLLVEEKSDQGLHCLPFRLHRLDSLLYGIATLF